MATSILPPQTAAIDPAAFSDDLAFCRRRTIVYLFITLLLLTGFWLRVSGLAAESLSEDELNKLQTVEEYRSNGLSGKNGEHPFLMKGLQTVSMIAAEKWNATSGRAIPAEAALRFPIALFGTLSILLIYLLASSLFQRSIGLIAAGLWAVEPMAVGFDRIAKEDSLVVFFFLLTQLLWIRSQSAAQKSNPKWTLWAWGSASAFAGLMASKYYPHLLAISGGYYNIFKNVPRNEWHMRARRWIIFFLVMGVTFLILNPTILLPDTWREMMKFSSENRIGHDSYEFMGILYRNQMSAWLAGVPWTFYYVFIAVKISLLTLALFLGGIPLAFRKRMGDGRFLLFFWAFMWFLPFTVLGGKFTRYFAFVTPLLCIVAATGAFYCIKWLTVKLKVKGIGRTALEYGLLGLIFGVPLMNSLAVSPHFRLFTNVIGGGSAAAGTYFPHDEFYDAGTQKAVTEVVKLARSGALVACETPGLIDYYLERAGRSDIKAVSLSDPKAVSTLSAGDIVITARGRRYFSNTQYLDMLSNDSPAAVVELGGVPAAQVYVLDDPSANALHAVALRQS